MKEKIQVVNSKGEKEPFSFKKIYLAARNCGAPKKLAFEIASQIKREAFDGISTAQIFERIFELLKERAFPSAIKFNLKKAMEKLGPTGFPFEKFVGKIFEKEGYKVQLNKIVPGFCLKYEIDVIAQKEKTVYIVECKYHQLPGGRVDLQVALANFARFLDIQKGKFLNSGVVYKSLLVTNTKFTFEAINYSRCVNVELLGWKFPPQKGLEKLIEKNNLFPITILPSVSASLGKMLVENGIVLVEDVFLPQFEKIELKEKEQILKEAKILLKK